MANYKIATEKGLFDILEEVFTEEDEKREYENREKLIEEQNRILVEKYGESCLYEDLFFTVNHSGYWGRESMMYDSIDQIICGMAIKDGADLIQFENGNLGYVGYYNGHEDVVEIVAKVKDIENYIHTIGGNEEDVDQIIDELREIIFYSLEEAKQHINNLY